MKSSHVHPERYNEEKHDELFWIVNNTKS
jgi:hypothetical protein